jgi:hypothetical protein
MSGADLVARWPCYLNEFMAEWAVPEDRVYAPGEPGQEPIPVLNTHDAQFYASWLRLHGSITKAEWRWPWEDIAHHAEGTGDDAQR